MTLVMVYVLFCVAVYVYPEAFFYGPSSEKSDITKARQNGYPAEEVFFKSADGTELPAWYTKPGKQNKIVVFMHGNSYNVEKFYNKMIPFVKAGYGTFMPEYRGFGGIKGRITQANLEADALAAVRFLQSRGYKNEDIIIYGMSLGSHMAVNTVHALQHEGAFAALVLEVPFDSLLNVTREIVPVPLPFELIVRDKYDNLSLIGDIKSPILIMGGSKDTLVPVVLAQNLYAHAPNPKEIIVYEGAGHNNLDSFKNYNDILSWLKSGK